MGKTQLPFVVNIEGGTLTPVSVPPSGDFEPNTIVVDVVATVDVATWELSVTLTALDPLTGWFPENPLVGLLYPNDEKGRGDGSISFLIRPHEGLPPGSEVKCNTVMLEVVAGHRVSNVGERSRYDDSGRVWLARLRVPEAPKFGT